MQYRRISQAALALGLVGAVAPLQAGASVVFQNSLSFAGNALDLAPGISPNDNRLGGFFSDLYYDRFSNSYYGLVDRGPGGGLISYQTRVQQFTLDVNKTTGAISNFQLQKTIVFKNAGTPLNGLNPLLLNGSVSTLGNSHDPEGFAVGKNGNLFVSDEYGPAVREFTPNGTVVRTFTTPANLLPKAGANLDFVNGRPTITTGRQDNRGYEGLAISADGKKLYAMLQDPLVNEGAQSDGRRSQNLRLVEFDVATGAATRQFAYQLESRTDINDRIPGTANDFSAANQGRSIGISAIIPIDGNRFLVIERDNRGVGVDDPLGLNPVGSKRIYEIDISGATDVSGISFADSNALPAGVVAVGKKLHLDVQAALIAAGLVVPEKLEGITIGPMLDDGSFALLLGTDNDFSVTQTGAGEQFDVCVGGGASEQVAIGTPCPAGKSLLPTYLYAFKDGDIVGYVAPVPVPEPQCWTLLLASALMLAGFSATRRRRLRREPTATAPRTPGSRSRRPHGRRAK